LVGFDWPSVEGPIAKIREEIAEIEDALARGNLNAAKRELGDVLFAVVNLSRFVDADPNDELRHATERFLTRFALVEKEVTRSGRTMKQCSLQELDEVWDRVKKAGSNT
jgi:uncharacterized protein YabN with tetrapyrrole methylase and pyrophosphatase domain